MRFFAPILAAGCTTIGMMASLHGCGSTTSNCPADDGGGDGGSEEGTDAGGSGMIHVRGTIMGTICPTVNPLGVGPENGGTVELTATINGDADDSGAIVPIWSAPSGSFSDPNALDTTFTCASAGDVTVTLTGTVPGCTQEASATVYCLTASQ
jgi:hypothetical protein